MTVEPPRAGLADPAPDSYAALAKSPQARRRDLQRMRAVATGLLAAMTALFVLTRHALWTGAPYLHAFAEAGMVGACADWFAVTAIFRRPLGLPIPHTAVVPENKRRLGAALGRFVEQNFLNPRVALRRLRRLDAVGLALRWLGEPRNARRLAETLWRIAPFVLSNLPREMVVRWAGVGARAGLEAIPAAPLAARALETLWAQGAGQEVLDKAVDALERALIIHRATILAKVRENSPRWLPRFVDEMLAARLISGVTQTLREMRAPGHPWRADVETRVAGWIAQLGQDPDLKARGEAMKRELLQSPLFARQIEAAGARIVEALAREDEAGAQSFAALVLNASATLATYVEKDPARLARINRTLRLWALRAVLPQRAAIGAYIAEVVERWNTATLVERLELQVGRDLQFIRINGTLVGGLVGLAIYVVGETWL